MSEKETFSPSAILAKATALGAQAAQTPQTPASNSVRPQVSEADLLKPRADWELTDASFEDDVLHGDGEGEAKDD